MKRLGFGFFIKEDVLTLTLSVLLWGVCLLCIYFFSDNFYAEGNSLKTEKDGRTVSYYEENVTIIR